MQWIGPYHPGESPGRQRPPRKNIGEKTISVPINPYSRLYS
ncbi:hypothetical protein LptCag_0313 [Leptospirillum ferriphilum]|uniref:Uncharacterized protein n=1 Tax=Leptospirillum ferriphilum TaxID=178606 RepID=A0A094WC71_9BACT|nr:hypothetical protein LptCag_0313 [Leptospirillum ferriphilum]